MPDKKLNAIKEIEFRINKCKEVLSDLNMPDKLTEIDNLLFDINDFMNDLKDEES